MIYPLRFEKVFIKKIWGGRALETELGMALPENEIIGESWEVSAHSNGMSIVENGKLKGKTLQEVYDTYKSELVGEKVYEEYGHLFPLLIKYLDINDRLSIQVHPEDEQAMKKHNELGKSESWYVIEASDDAKLILGMAEGITKDQFVAKAKANDFSDMFKVKSVKAGDLIDINPGTVHASLEGSILIAEIQENSDITYRIYDFDREENGIKRELHIDEAAETIDFSKDVDVVSTIFNEGEIRKKIVEKKYYTIEKIKITSELEDINNESMIIYSILDGAGKLEWGTDYKECLQIHKGESLLVPVNVKVKLNGNIEILRTTI